MEGLAFTLILSIATLLFLAYSDSADAESLADLKGDPIIQNLIARFDEAVTHELEIVDPGTGLRKKTDALIKAEKLWDWDLLTRPEEARVAIAKQQVPIYMEGYWFSRLSARTVGTMGLAYACPLSKYCRDSRLLESFNKGVRTYAEHQSDDGEFIFTPIKFATVYGTHEQAWRLEPFLLAYGELKDILSPADRERWQTMLNKGMAFLSSHPNHEPNNRGCVWAGVMALGGHVLGREDYIDQAREGWYMVNQIFSTSGEVYEGSGPDLIYSLISLYYGFLYRTMAQDASADRLLVRGLEWMQKVHDANFNPYNEIGTRKYARRGATYELLPLYVYYARERPEFLAVAKKLMTLPPSLRLGLGVHGSEAITPWMAANEYEPAAKPASTTYGTVECFELYDRRRGAFARDGRDSEYIPVRHAYQTLVSLSGVHPWKGIQHWTLGTNEPLLQPNGETGVSTVITSGGNLAEQRVDSYQVGRSLADIVTARTGGIYRTYVFTPESTAVLQTSAEPARTRWVTLREPSVSNPAELTVKESGASIFFSGNKFAIQPLDGRFAVDFETPAGTSWFAFTASGTFAPIEGIKQESGIAFAFRDGSGEYLVIANHSEKRGRIAISVPKGSGTSTFEWKLDPLSVSVIDARCLSGPQ